MNSTFRESEDGILQTLPGDNLGQEIQQSIAGAISAPIVKASRCRGGTWAEESTMLPCMGVCFDFNGARLAKCFKTRVVCAN